MHCMKCGKEVREGQVFCPDCLADMEQYPVKPGTVIQIPHRQPPAPRKPVPKKKVPTPEEQNNRLRKILRFFVIAWLVTLLVAAVLAYPAYQYVIEENHFLPGQNYSVFEEMLPREG